VKVVLADYGAGNLRSVCAAFERAGAEPVVSADPREVLETELAVIAGVGNTGSAARALEERGLAAGLRERVGRARPVFGICVGMQLFFEECDEGGSGLGLLHGPVKLLQARRVPHMGWNALELTGETEVLAGLDGRDLYFAHSYAARPEATVCVARVEHDTPVAAAVEDGLLAGVQFHPERSGPAGAQVLRQVLAWSRSA
jgi:glutamine amidotransferase